jgi:Cation/multidrug efflux pump
VVLVIFLFLRRGMPTLIAGVTVPLALAATFGVMWLAGYSLDNLSLMALTISVGFVVDDAIVVIENVARHLEAGETPLQAALNGAREIGFTILSMSLSLVAVFIPLLFMGGVIGYFFREFSVTLAIAIFASMIVSLTLTPALSGKLMRAEDHDAPQPRWARVLEAGFSRLLGAYRIGLDWALRHGRLMLLVTLGTVALTFWLYGQVPTGLFPQQDTGQMFGSVRASPSISFDAMSAKLERR